MSVLELVRDKEIKGYPVTLEAVLVAEVGVGDVQLETFRTLEG